LRVSTGVAILQEATQVEADLAQTVQEEIEAAAVLGRSLATLNTLIGRRAYAPLVLVDLPEAAPQHPVLAPTTDPPSPEALRELGLDRPDLLALRQEVRQAEAQVQMARAARWPQVNLFQNYLKRVPATLMGSFAWSLGASLVQSVYDGGRIRAQVAAARAERTRRRATVAVSGLQIEEQVEQARITLDAAEARIEAEERRVEAAAAALEIARRRLRAGVAPPIEVTEAETVVARALTAASAARFGAARARVQLAFLAGLAYPDVVLGLAVLAPVP
jgi:outer membrane protein TolC